MRKQALISVSDKTGVVDFAKGLVAAGYHILSTGGTAKLLAEQGVPCQEVADYTGFPEMLDGRVKTLDPHIHAGILARRPVPEHMKAIADHGIDPIDIVCVNLYPFEQTIARPDCTFELAIENIDIGGPTMIRAAAKNHESVAVIVDPTDYDRVLAEINEKGEVSADTRLALAKKVFAHTARYDGAITNYLTSLDENKERTKAFPDVFNRQWIKAQDMRYGENPHQKAAFYREHIVAPGLLAGFHQHQGKELSYNNIADSDAAWEAVRSFETPACVIIKHANPCGAAIGSNALEAYQKAFRTDPKSAFGGIIACNREVPFELVEHFADQNKQFVEVIIAPSYTAEALERMAKRPNLRVLATGGVDHGAQVELRSIDGGMLVQEVDHVTEDPATFTFPTDRKPTDAEMAELEFAWKVCKGIKSNAILVSKGKAGIGMGPGQPNRVDSALLACERAEDFCEREGVEKGGFACASDAFFPFRDNVDVLAAHGVTCIIQPGGSKRDDESIQACNEHNIAMVFTGARHFRH